MDNASEYMGAEAVVYSGPASRQPTRRIPRLSRLGYPCALISALVP